MKTSLLLFGALEALLAPAPWGLAAPALAVGMGRVRPGACLGLLMLALAGIVPPPAPPPSPRPGAAWEVCGRWREPPGAKPRLDTPGGPLPIELAADLRAPRPGEPVRVLVRVGGTGRATAVQLQVTGPAEGAWLDRLAASARLRIRQLVHGPRRALLASLLLGDRSQLDGATYAAFRATGSMHLLALSGLHVALLAAVAGRFLSARLTLLLLIGFTSLAGPRAPLLRALCGRLLRARLADHPRRLSPLRGLAWVALMLAVAMGPNFVQSLSGRLSFLAVGGLIAGARLGRGPFGALLGPMGAVLATAPLCVDVFGEFQPLGILVTPVLTPMVAAVLALGSISVLPGSGFVALDPLLGPALDGSAQGLLLAVQGAARILPPPIHPGPPPLEPTLFGLLIVSALAALRRPWQAAPGNPP